MRRFLPKLNMNKSALYRPCVGVALFNNDGKVFVGERIDTPNAWQMPQGGIDPDEDIIPAAMRELKEEIGTNNAEILKIHGDKIRYELPLERQKEFWNGKYVGQEQTWIAMRFLGDDKEINITADDHPEFSQWRWVALEDTLYLIVPFKRKTYEILINSFQEFS